MLGVMLATAVSWDIVWVFALLLIAVILFVTEKFPVDVVAISILAALFLLDLVGPEEGLSGFASTATVTVGAMFVLSAGLPRTGAVPGRLCMLRRLPPRAGEGPTWPVSIRWLCSRCFWKRICYLIFSSVVFTNNRDNLLHRQ